MAMVISLIWILPLLNSIKGKIYGQLILHYKYFSIYCIYSKGKSWSFVYNLLKKYKRIDLNLQISLKNIFHIPQNNWVWKDKWYSSLAVFLPPSYHSLYNTREVGTRPPFHFWKSENKYIGYYGTRLDKWKQRSFLWLLIIWKNYKVDAN